MQWLILLGFWENTIQSQICMLKMFNRNDNPYSNSSYYLYSRCNWLLRVTFDIHNSFSVIAQLGEDWFIFQQFFVKIHFDFYISAIITIFTCFNNILEQIYCHFFLSWNKYALIMIYFISFFLKIITGWWLPSDLVLYVILNEHAWVGCH